MMTPEEVANQAFANHRIKNLKHGRWEFSDGGSNYRIYVTKLPEDNLAITGDCEDLLFNRGRGFGWLQKVLSYNEIPWHTITEKLGRPAEIYKFSSAEFYRIRDEAIENDDEDIIAWHDKHGDDVPEIDSQDLWHMYLMNNGYAEDHEGIPKFKEYTDMFQITILGLREFFMTLSKQTHASVADSTSRYGGHMFKRGEGVVSVKSGKLLTVAVDQEGAVVKTDGEQSLWFHDELRATAIDIMGCICSK